LRRKKICVGKGLFFAIHSQFFKVLRLGAKKAPERPYPAKWRSLRQRSLDEYVKAMAASDVINDSFLAEKAWEEFRTETKGQTYKGIV